MEDLSLHILDIVENSIDAGARKVRISVREAPEKDLLAIEVADDGRGMNQSTLEKAADPFYTTRRTRRVGLGLSLLQQAAREAGGEVHIESQTGVGTTVSATFQYGHIDRKPMGDLSQTLLALIVAHPEIEFTFVRRDDGSEVSWNTNEIKTQLGSVPFGSPEGIRALRKHLEKMKVTPGS